MAGYFDKWAISLFKKLPELIHQEDPAHDEVHMCQARIWLVRYKALESLSKLSELVDLQARCSEAWVATLETAIAH